jgi:two-component system sensor histidine kinase BaeS
MDVIGMMPRLTVRDADGRPVMRSPMPSRPESKHHKVKFPVMANGKRVGTLLMVPTPIPVEGLDRQFRDDQLHAFYLAVLPALLITLLLAIPLGYHFARPVQRLAKGIHRLARGDYKTRLDERRNDELGELARDFNYLAKTLENSELQRREGMASVSHELRTPLATMIAAVEAMQDGVRPLNAEQLQRLSGTMDHLNQLVDDLYQLALADVGKLVCQRKRIEWDSVINDAVDAMRGKLEERGLTVNCAPQRNVAVLGDPLRLRQVVINLLENCHRYTEADGTIQIRLLRVGGDARMTIADTGPGVGRDHLATLFERFTRVDASRSREHGGAGLGLALVKAIAEAHGGKATAAIGKEGGLEIALSIPLAEDCCE